VSPEAFEATAERRPSYPLNPEKSISVNLRRLPIGPQWAFETLTMV
jgi:hypothetical protein